jgi:hypothetical protein
MVSVYHKWAQDAEFDLSDMVSLKMLPCYFLPPFEALKGLGVKIRGQIYD